MPVKNTWSFHSPSLSTLLPICPNIQLKSFLLWFKLFTFYPPHFAQMAKCLILVFDFMQPFTQLQIIIVHHISLPQAKEHKILWSLIFLVIFYNFPCTLHAVFNCSSFLRAIPKPRTDCSWALPKAGWTEKLLFYFTPNILLLPWATVSRSTQWLNTLPWLRTVFGT